jgi:hypothetical protein
MIYHANEIEQGRLSAAGWACDRDVIAPLDVQRHALQSVHTLGTKRIVAPDSAKGDGTRAHAIASRRKDSAIGNDAARHAG